MNGWRDADSAWLLQAVAVAAQGTRAVRPNPRVGCVLVAPDGTLVGAGFHARVGGPHAEVEALRVAGERARGATAYVTLEPCNHTGRTGPCTEALLAAGVVRVVIGQPDPHPLASGGAGRLRQAGVPVAFAPQGTPAALAAADVAEVFLIGEQQQRAWLQLKLAATIDGKTAAADGSSRWITGPASRQAVHHLRAEADAVLVGSGTAVADNPRLDARNLPDYAGPLPLRVVLDRRLRLPASHHLCDTSRQPTRVYTLPDQRSQSIHKQLAAQGVQVVALPDGGDWLQRVLADLRTLGCHQVLCEGGATLATALLREQLVDRLDVMLGPLLLGQGAPLLGDLGISSLTHAQRWRWSVPQTCGDDLWLTARPLRTAPAVAD